MTTSHKGIDLIKEFEGFRADAYLDQGGVPTIGYGSTMYANGQRIKLGDSITESDATSLLMWNVGLKTAAINGLTYNVKLNQDQFDALSSFTYNVGVGAFTNSTLLKVLKQNPSDPEIRNQFLRWNKVNGQPNEGLTNRRTKEADTYFSL